MGHSKLNCCNWICLLNFLHFELVRVPEYCSHALSLSCTPLSHIVKLLLPNGYNLWRTLVLLRGPLLALFWTSVRSTLDIKTRMDSLTCTLCHLCTMDSKEHLPASWQPVWQVDPFCHILFQVKNSNMNPDLSTSMASWSLFQHTSSSGEFGYESRCHTFEIQALNYRDNDRFANSTVSWQSDFTCGWV